MLQGQLGHLLLLAALRVVSEGSFGVADFGTDLAGVVENPREMLRFDVAANVGDGLVLEQPTDGTDPDRAISSYVHIKVFCR